MYRQTGISALTTDGKTNIPQKKRENLGRAIILLRRQQQQERGVVFPPPQRHGDE